jgi:hypothetical protein
VWLAKKAGVPILPAASRVWLRGFEHPEAFLLLGEPIPPDEKALEESLRDLLSTLDELYFSTHPREVLPGFHPILFSRRSLDERLKTLTEKLANLFRV